MTSTPPRRRRPMARALVLLAALASVGGVYSATVSSTSMSVADDNAAFLAEGKNIYGTNCSSCHGPGGQGSAAGPDIRNAGSAAVDFQMATGRMPAAHNLSQGERRPTRFTAKEIASVGAYVDTFGTGPKVPQASVYDTKGLSEKDLAEGGEIFRTNCAQCHNFTGGGGAMPSGRYAPSLTEVDNKHIYEAMRTGPGPMPQFNEPAMRDEDARKLIGYLDALRAQPNKGGLGLGSLGPVSEGLWGWILGIGSMTLFAVWIAAKGARK